MEFEFEDVARIAAEAMNNYLIGIGSYVSPLTDSALKAAAKIGKVKVDVGDTACKIPDAADYINKVKALSTKQEPEMC